MQSKGLKMDKINHRLDQIKPIDQEDYDKYEAHWDSLVHPTGALGDIELLTIRLCSIYKDLPQEIGKKDLLVFCADNGILEEDVSSSPEILTKLLAEEMATTKIGANALMDRTGGHVHVVDLGIKDYTGHEDIIDRRIMNGTNNFLKEDALGIENTLKAIHAGIDLADDLIDSGSRIIGIGELGMGNTTTSAAVIKALTGKEAKEVVGPGSGVNPDQYQKKLRAVDTCIDLRQVDVADSIDIASKLGGLDICAMLGVIIACASRRIPVVLDGIITIAGASLCYNMNKDVKDYIFTSHKPHEPGAKTGLDYIGHKGYFDLSMRLGEGAGTSLMMSLLDDGLYMMNNMTKFDQTDIRNTLYNIRDEG